VECLVFPHGGERRETEEERKRETKREKEGNFIPIVVVETKNYGQIARSNKLFT